MNLAPRILGTTACTQLQRNADEAILQVGSDRLGRRELAAVGCYNFTAARNLSAILKPFQLPSLKYLYENVPPEGLALPHMGVISLAVLGAAFEARKIGGEAPLENWVRAHAGSDKQAMVTFHTLKAREAAERAAEKKAVKQRKHARRNQAHHLRLARFGDRQAASA
jgi:hypothetical protein